MIEFVPYSPQDLSRIELQPVQAKWYDRFIQPGYAESLAVRGRSWTAIEGDCVLGSAGFSPQWEGRFIAWAIFGRNVPKSFWPRIVAKIRAEMRALPQPCRVEITVPYGFGAGCRLASALGFKVEGLMKAFGPDGADHFLYAQVL